MQGVEAAGPEEAPGFLAFYDRAVPEVYGYLAARCGAVGLAEDLTAETFLAAVDAVRRPDPVTVSVPWAIGVARHKLADHWRRQARQDRRLHLLEEPGSTGADAWEAQLDALRARQTLEQVAPHYRSALTFRYLDDLSVPEVAALLGRTVRSTESLLVRARTAFRHAYEGEEAQDG